MESRVASTEIVDFGVLYRFDERLREEFQAMIDSCKMLHDIKQKCSRTSEQLARLGCDDSTVLKFDSRRRMSGKLLVVLGSRCGASEVGCNLSLIEQHLYLGYLRLVASATCKLVGGIVVAAYYLVL